MKGVIFILLLAVQISNMQAQKEDNVWVLGYRYSFEPVANGIYFHFGDSLQITYASKPMSMLNSSTSICDASGNLLIYSNGCYMETSDGVEVEYSEGLNPGILYGNCEDNDGYNISQNMILLPDPMQDSIYHLFHLPVDKTPEGSYFNAIMHSSFNMAANNGNGTTLFKNQILISENIHFDGIHAVRHANGRDWWILAAKQADSKYYILLFSPAGIEVHEQDTGDPTLDEAQGQIVFSPDGTKVARFNTRDDLHIFDFDRCSGILSNPLHVPIQDDADIEIFAGLAWSADSRYLYAAEARRLLQFDTWTTDLAAGMIIIAEAEPPVCPLSGSIGFMELGPDGMIYSRPFNGQKCLHRIKHPERGGTACELQQNYYQLEFPYANLSHFPNFRLGPIDGSPCDTLGLDNHPLAGWRYDKTGGLGVDFTSVSWYEPEQWLWDFGDPASGAGNNSAEKHPSHAFSAPGAYEVCLTVSNQYGSDTKCKTVWVTTVGTGEPGNSETVKIYPNPTTGKVQWSELKNEEITLRAYDALGRLALEQKTTEARVDLSGLPEGIYFVALIGEKGQVIASKPIVLSKR